MAPSKIATKPVVLPNGSNLKIGIKTRSHNGTVVKKESFSKRKAEESPLKRLTVKRATLGETGKENSAVPRVKSVFEKTVMLSKITKTLAKKTVLQDINDVDHTSNCLNKNEQSLIPVRFSKENVTKAKQPVKKLSTVPSKVSDKGINRKPLGSHNFVKDVKTKEESVTVLKKPTAQVDKYNVLKPQVKKQVELSPSYGVVTRRSLARKSAELEKTTDSSLYVSALEDLNLDDNVKKGRKQKNKKEIKPPVNVVDFDKEQIGDPSSVATYAMDIFNYLKSREKDFEISDYMPRQKDLNVNMRALLVDWMVEVQENYELNHETLYLAMKLVDLYLSKEIIRKENLQLVACTGLLIASKYDERFPPSVEDFLYVCDGLYTNKELTNMEFKLLTTIDFQLGIPLSYRFLRRYARCAKIGMKILTLARFILEYNLMDYNSVRFADSKMAAAALYMALLMAKEGQWTSTLEYYSGYKTSDFVHICQMFNSYLKKDAANLMTIKNKYSHKLFFEVAKIPLVDTFDDVV
ncbi:G2/mitotic-specific cyclin-B3 [Cimex lectularius]|uniref:G2/mitotic-specific cyclin-B3 n=1 Tax=Cimex lectularius TaxID=79782 RepID=A0A8I6RUL2_CIMLE|nr:G2/mitotic-specific cyclin-B3 [Cimex lectularius]